MDRYSFRPKIASKFEGPSSETFLRGINYSGVRSFLVPDVFGDPTKVLHVSPSPTAFSRCRLPLRGQGSPNYRLTASSARYLDEDSDMCISRLADWYFSEHHMGEAASLTWYSSWFAGALDLWVRTPNIFHEFQTGRRRERSGSSSSPKPSANRVCIWRTCACSHGHEGRRGLVEHQVAPGESSGEGGTWMEDRVPWVKGIPAPIMCWCRSRERDVMWGCFECEDCVRSGDPRRQGVACRPCPRLTSSLLEARIDSSGFSGPSLSLKVAIARGTPPGDGGGGTFAS